MFHRLLDFSFWNTKNKNTYLLTPWSRFLLEKLTGFQLVKKFPAFYGKRRFITAFTSARHLFLSWVSSIQSIPPHPTSWKSILILSSHLGLGFPHQNPVYAPPLPHTRYMPAHLILYDLITRTILGEEYRSLRSLLCTRVGTLIVATIYLQLIQNRYMFQSFTVLQCSHQHCVKPVASDVEVVGYL